MITGFAFTKIIVADLIAIEPFYRDALGLTIKTRITVDEPGYALRETVFSVGEDGVTLLNLVQYLDRPYPAPGEAVVGLSVSNVDAVIAAAVAAGGAVVTPPVDLPDHGVKIAYIGDPEGHLLELLQTLG